MKITNNVHPIKMCKFYFEYVQFQQSSTEIMKILENAQFWCQNQIFKNLGEF